MNVPRVSFCIMLSILSAACIDKSALDPAGREAERIADLFFLMVIVAVIVWLGVVGLTIYAIHRPQSHSESRAKFLIIGGGVAVPTLLLAVLLSYGLAMLPDLVARAPKGSLTIRVIGEQWWWRVRYYQPGGKVIELANEIRLPVGEPVEFHLESIDVIHSFWIPSLGGKRDMIPGRMNRLTLLPTKLGSFRGVCAEYCGTSHALMSFPVVVMKKKDFTSWLETQARVAQPPVESFAAQGEAMFLSNGCGACHTVRGTLANGVIGPDLTHVGSRISLGAGTLPNNTLAYLNWIAITEDLKPGVHMPAFGMLPQDNLHALAAYLKGLK